MQTAKELYRIGQKINIEITAINGHGEGIAHITNNDQRFTVFVPGVKKDATSVIQNNKPAKLLVEITGLYTTYITAKKT